MSDPLLSRITETVQRAHDTNLELLELADELREHASRAVGETTRLQKHLKLGTIDTPGSMEIPEAIKPRPRIVEAK